jgi:hypothetical protein
MTEYKQYVLRKILSMKPGDKERITEDTLKRAFADDIKEHGSLEAAIRAHLGDDYILRGASNGRHVSGYWMERKSA